MKSRDLPACRTDAMVLHRTRLIDRDGYLACDTPDCRATWYGHRLVLDEPPEDPEHWFRRWEQEHGGKGIGTAYLVWEHRLPRPIAVPDHAELSEDRAMMHDDWVEPTPPTPSLRPLTADDDAEMQRLMAQEYGDDTDSLIYHRWHADQIWDHGDAGRAQLWGAFADGLLVGTASIVWDRREAQIQNVLVATSHRRQGLARALVTAVIGAYRDQSMGLIFLVTEKDSPAEHLYRSCGFRHVTFFYELSRVLALQG